MTVIDEPPARFRRKADQYDDPNLNYLNYWHGRDYEHAAEEIALKRLLGGRRFERAADVGGGYGRLSVLIGQYADSVTLAEPSRQQLDLAECFLADHPEIERRQIQASELLFDDASLDLLVMVRVMHHLPDPAAELAEIARVLRPGGIAVIEVANSAHARNRIRFALRGKAVPRHPRDLRSHPAGEDGIPFVNHHPNTVRQQLADAGLHVERALSVSNLRSTWLKRVLATGVLLGLERRLQTVLAGCLFGPSIFLLARKADKQH